MAKLSKRIRAIREKVPAGKVYAVKDAFALLKDLPLAKFRESVDISVNLGVDSRKSDQAIRGSLVLPKGTGRQVRVAVFTSSAHADAALKAGADIVGLEDLAEKVKAGNLDFDLVLATPDAMRIVGQLGQVLGPRGLMPNPKDGTVTTDIATAVQNARKGQIRYRTDKAGIVHCMIGKLDFSVEDLIQNFETVIAALKKAKPSTAKGIYFKKVTVSSTMGPGLAIDIASMDS
ncbi:MAG: 50S ribosomal protein L1 [Gammaproteobacteria bacterium RIFCSPHIGHO2_12_FULL_41_20]|nr:MAG: 50S ribosomal protein L1 [Gammaproteobacteria bacterium RIFCSPHIGHO2_12_FULL_41_20]